MLDFEPSHAERTQDCWVRGDGVPDSLSLLPPSHQPIELKRSGSELPSRVAENLYWLGRSMESAEGQARLLRALVTRVELEGTGGATPVDPAWLRFLGSPTGDLPDGLSVQQRIKHAALGSPAPGNLRHAIRECVRLAQAARDRLSTDAWRLVARMERYLLQAVANNPLHDDDLTDVTSLLNHLVLELVAYGGLMSESMTRTLGWHFLDLGRRIERARRTANLLQATLVQPMQEERPILATLLEVCDSAMTYRTRYLADMRPVPVIDLLLTDEINPRSVAYQLDQVRLHIDALPRDSDAANHDADQRLAEALLQRVLSEDPEVLAEPGPWRVKLADLILFLNEQLPLLDQALTARYLAHTDLPTQFADVAWTRTDQNDETDSGGAAP